MKDNELVEVEIKHGDDKILLKRSHPPQAAMTTLPLTVSSVPAEAAPMSEAQAKDPAPAKDEGLVEIKSPMVGTYYANPSPDSEPYVEPDSKVTSQTVVCIIEAMKVMNEIKAETSGTIVEIMVTNGQAIEYGQVLFKVRPD